MRRNRLRRRLALLSKALAWYVALVLIVMFTWLAGQRYGSLDGFVAIAPRLFAFCAAVVAALTVGGLVLIGAAQTGARVIENRQRRHVDRMVAAVEERHPGQLSMCVAPRLVGGELSEAQIGGLSAPEPLDEPTGRTTGRTTG